MNLRLLFLALATTLALSAKIDHFVVLMLENRSFDHMCGWLKKKHPKVDGLKGTEFNIANGTKFKVRDTCPYVNPFDPDHEFDAVTEQLMGKPGAWIYPPPMDGFAKDAFQHNFPEYWMSMYGFSPERVPAISTLAEEFALFDHYYASHPGPTIPNRLYFHSGTSDGAANGDHLPLLEGWPQRTLFDFLDSQNATWKAYYQDISDLLYLRNPRKPQNIINIQPWENFKTSAAEGTLPQYTWLSPQFYPHASGPAKDQHPDHDVVDGEKLIAEVYSTLRSSPKWNSTVFMLTYDEHGGFFDHVPPHEGLPNPDGKNATDSKYPFNFTREGVRVCTVVASPLVPKGTLVQEAESAQYEHGSIFNTLRNIFGFENLPLTKRYEWAAPFDHVVSLDEPRTDCPESLPTPSDESLTAERSAAVLAEQQQRAPNGLQKELFRLAESLHGRDGSDIGRFATQEEMGNHVRQMMEKFRASQARKL